MNSIKTKEIGKQIEKEKKKNIQKILLIKNY